MLSITYRSGQYSLSKVAQSNQNVTHISSPIREACIENIKASISKNLQQTFFNDTKYQIVPEIFVAFVSGGLFADKIGIPNLAKPLVSAYVASLIFTSSTKIAELALGKLARNKFAKALEVAIHQTQTKIHIQLKNQIIDDALEQGVSLSENEIQQIHQAVLPKLSPKQLVSSILVGGTIFAAMGYASVFITGGNSAISLSSNYFAQNATLLLIRTACGAFLADLNEQLIGLGPQSRFTLSSAFASFGIADLINATLPQEIDNAAKIITTGLTVSTSILPILKFQQSINQAIGHLTQFIQAKGLPIETNTSLENNVAGIHYRPHEGIHVIPSSFPMPHRTDLPYPAVLSVIDETI